MCEHKNTIVKFFQFPLNLVWIDGEITLFEDTISLHGRKNVLIDTSVSSEIANGPAFNTFRLYIDNILVAQGGYEAESSAFAPNLSTVSSTFGTKFPKFKKNFTVK